MKTRNGTNTTRKVEEIIRALLLLIGEDPDREGLIGTPKRVAEFWKEFMDYDPGNYDRTFEAIETDQMVVVTGIKVWSLCEHHLLPFWANISMGYITRDKVLGLSKFARIAHMHAHKLQLQERLVQEIADSISRLANSPDVAVLAEGVHTCMTMRGIRSEGTMKTSVTRGAFRDKPETRAEFLRMVG